eukprot:m.45608 g.45608  ORF g.45608 m.45608 type:complete len:1034 (+) comp11795_c0_seq3:145-3246(+)
MESNSRLIVKNLPRNIKEARLRSIFEQHGEITQIRIIPKRRFAYIGYLTDKQAAAAKRYRHETFIDTSKIEVGVALPFGDEQLPRPWSKFSAGSSAFDERKQKFAERVARASKSKQQAQQEATLKQIKESNALSVDERMRKEQQLLAKLYAVEADPAADPKLKEFLDVMRPSGKKHTWANDAGGTVAARPGDVDKAQRKARKVKALVEAVDMRRPGGEGLKTVRTHLAFEDDSDDEYQEVKAAGGNDDDEGSGSSDDEKSDDDADKPALNSGLSDMEYLKLKMAQSKAAANEDEDDDAEGSGSGSESDGAKKETSSDSDSSGSDSEDDSGAADKTRAALGIPAKRSRRDTASKEAAASESGDGAADPPRFTVRLRGLPFTAKEPEIRDFFHPLELVDIRMVFDREKRPAGRAFVDFASEKDLKRALKHDKDHMGSRYVEVSLDEEDRPEFQEREYDTEDPAKKYADNTVDVALIGETGRLFVRNLAYACTEDHLRKLFELFGPLSEVAIPIDPASKKSKAVGFVTFVMPEHAVQAFSKLDGHVFQGRLLHVLPAKPRHDEEDAGVEEIRSFKKKRERKRKAESGSSFNWNTLFMRAGTVADAMASSYGVTKSDILHPDADSSAAVRMALGETHIVAENKEFLKKNGVVLEQFDSKATRLVLSKTVILVKNTPFSITEQDIRTLFGKYGALGRVVLPPSHTMALIEFDEPSEARSAFRGLAYSKYKHEPLYLEWAPEGVLSAAPKGKEGKRKRDAGATDDAAAASSDEGEEDEDDEDDGGSDKEGKSDAAGKGADTDDGDGDAEAVEGAGGLSTLFVKNLNFETTEDGLHQLFAGRYNVRHVEIATKSHPKTGGRLSMGFGFVEFKTAAEAQKALKEQQGCALDDHKLILKLSTKTSRRNTSAQEKTSSSVPKRHGTKIIVRNVAFEATKKDIREVFAAFGQVKSVRIPKKFDGAHRGFAFVDFLTKQDAKTAFEALSGSTHLYGRRLVLEWAQAEDDVATLRAKTSKQFNLRGSGRSGGKKIRLDKAVSEFLS